MIARFRATAHGFVIGLACMSIGMMLGMML